MKYLPVLGMAAALIAAGAPAMAQTAPSTPDPAMRAQFQQMRTQMEQIRTTERSAILNALTPAHKALLASVAGQLATSVTPDYDDAVTQLDNALSPGEKTAILNAAQSARTQMRSLMQNVRAAERPGMRRTPDAGRILLGLASSRPEMREPGRP